ncbi:MAG: Uncharacterized protein RBG13Loki_3423, partial [Promethearchaeota archaeon CR_4]
MYIIKRLSQNIGLKLENYGKRIDRIRLQNITIDKKEFIEDLKNAIYNKIGYAAGKIGRCEEYFMYYKVLIEKVKNENKIKEFEKHLVFNFMNQTGLFPPDFNFILEYSEFYVNQVKNMDCLGICYATWELQIIKAYEIKNKLIYYVDQEPDRSIPSNDEACYLNLFKDKNILLICPFADILRQRATKDIFEGVWEKIGKKWFYPKSVEALQFPYGFSSKTQEQYSTAFDLLDYIKLQIDKKDFDIALIAAAGLAIPISSYIKNTGRIGIS